MKVNVMAEVALMLLLVGTLAVPFESESVHASPAGPAPDIIYPSDGSMVTGIILIEANQTNPALSYLNVSYALFEYSADGTEWFFIDNKTDAIGGDLTQISPDTWNVRWDTDPLPSGLYLIRVTMEDDVGNVGTDEIGVEVNKPPVAVTTASYDASYLVTFNGSESYDVDGEVLNWTWNLGDGTMASGPVVQHRYEVVCPQSTYHVSFTVTDNSGLENTSLYFWNYHFLPYLLDDTCCVKVKDLKIKTAWDDNSGKKGDGKEAWPLKEKKLGKLSKSRFAFEIEASIEGDPKCVHVEKQEVKATWSLDGKIGHKTWQPTKGEPKEYPQSGKDYGPDEEKEGEEGGPYSEPWTYKEHLADKGKIIWFDDPGMNEALGKAGDWMKADFKVTVVGCDGNGFILTFHYEWTFCTKDPEITDIKKEVVKKVQGEIKPKQSYDVTLTPMTINAHLGEHAMWYWKTLDPEPAYMQVLFPPVNNPFNLTEGFNRTVPPNNLPYNLIETPPIAKLGTFNYTISFYSANWTLLWTTQNTVIHVYRYVQGDVNMDEIVDIFDMVSGALAFGSHGRWGTTSADPNWNPEADLYGDNIIDLFDLVTIALNFGKTA